jgi:hypothetical protein
MTFPDTNSESLFTGLLIIDTILSNMKNSQVTMSAFAHMAMPVYTHPAGLLG